MSFSAVCRDCRKTGREVEECRIRLVQFGVYGRKCPREEPDEPKVVGEVVGDLNPGRIGERDTLRVST